MGNIVALLKELHEVSDEVIRAAVGECLGRLYLINVESIESVIGEYLGSKNATSRAVGLCSIRVILHDKSSIYEDAIIKLMTQFTFELLKDSDISVRKQSLSTLKTALHWKPELTKTLLTPAVLSDLYEETRIRKELIRQVTVGPFKHNIDDGLETRKVKSESPNSKKQYFTDTLCVDGL